MCCDQALPFTDEELEAQKSQVLFPRPNNSNRLQNLYSSCCTAWVFPNFVNKSNLLKFTPVALLKAADG
jgi:hypothetical protein